MQEYGERRGLTGNLKNLRCIDESTLTQVLGLLFAGGGREPCHQEGGWCHGFVG